MADLERLTVTLPAAMAVAVKGAVADGDYASSSAVVCEALDDWARKRDQQHALSDLKADLAHGLADLEAGRVADFDAARIVARGRARSSRSA